MSNHDKVYGICESKCFVETMSKDEMIRRMVLISTGEEPITNFSNYYKGRTETTLPYVETHFATNMDSMFEKCSNLIKVFDLNTSKVTDFSNIFYNCSSLTEIPDLDLSSFDPNGYIDSWSFSFRGCSKLTTLRDNPYAPEGKRWQFDDYVFFGNCPLDKTSILKVFNGLQTVINKTITISSTTNSYLSDEDKQIAINKGWTISVQ
jgi:hypothetical protein